MNIWVRVTILPIWDTPAQDTREARERGELRVKFLDLAEEFEQKIREAAESK